MISKVKFKKRGGSEFIVVVSFTYSFLYLRSNQSAKVYSIAIHMQKWKNCTSEKWWRGDKVVDSICWSDWKGKMTNNIRKPEAGSNRRSHGLTPYPDVGGIESFSDLILTKIFNIEGRDLDNKKYISMWSRTEEREEDTSLGEQRNIGREQRRKSKDRRRRIAH